jgi:hypothetical protein
MGNTVNFRQTTGMAENPDVNEIIREIISINQKQAEFWRNAHGWAPSNASELLSISRLDWQVSLSETLSIWKTHTDSTLSDGELILAWANLGALVEGTMKLFLSVYYDDYCKDEIRYKEKPDTLAFEKLKQFLSKKDIPNREQKEFIDLVQYRRNAIHAYKDRELGDKNEYCHAIARYLNFLRTIDSRLPYPD